MRGYRKKRPLIGFIGQGWVGKNYADSFEDRGFRIIRYGLEKEFLANKRYLHTCDIVFIAVPTPSSKEGFDGRILRSALKLVGKGKIAVIKSTIPPGTTKMLTRKFPDLRVIHLPEFLRETFARYDVDNPERLIIGIPEDTKEYRDIADLLVNIHTRANHTEVVPAETAEFIKYAHNTLGFAVVVFSNILYDYARAHGIDWSVVKEAILNNSWFPSKYLDPVHKNGRGAGGHCFIKDFAALRAAYERGVPGDREGALLLRAFEKKNIRLLKDSKKDLGIVRGVYGEI